MTRISHKLKSLVAAAFIFSAPAFAEGDRLDSLFEALATAEGTDAEQIAEKIALEWSKSGSAAMDLLLDRGRDALEAGDTASAIGHLTALVDHAPDFAEAYNSRAVAYFGAKTYGPALADIQMALALNPRHFGAMGGLALIAEEIGAPAIARDALAALIALYPGNEDAVAALGRLEQELDGTAL
ncbi:tetratricopeptide repeat protein [Palleronia caenipelagi]|uniref:Tetratricopeptide repeat protein n=2 Tax=Palleronia caenipelagi TaxID=2489174 RepID=A0A547Q378_9RHOB|nr:tetratricopeptide repeat protein [Palleronia caenipelagi]